MGSAAEANGGPTDGDRRLRLEEHVRRLLDGISDGYAVLDEDGTILDWNPAAGYLLGWTRQEVVGRRLVLEFPAPGDGAREGEGARNGGGDGGGAAGDLSPLLAGQRPADPPRIMEVPLADREGRVVQARLRVWATDGGWGTRHHILFSGLGPHVHAAHAGQCAVGSIVTSSGVAIVGEDLKGRILTWNTAAEEMYGYPAAEVLGRSGRMIVPADGRDDAERLVAEARSGRHIPGYETIHRRRDGTAVEVSVTMSPVRDPAGTVTGVSLIARDITDQRQASADLEAALESVRRSEASSRRFLAHAAHQLRTPLAGIRACTDALAGGASAAEGEALLAHLVEETERAARMVRGLLRMARADRAAAPVPVPCDLLGECERAAQRARMLAPHLAVDVRPAGSGPYTGLLLDPEMIEEILGNLLDNTIRHARGRISLEVLRPGPQEAEIRVTDDGPGLEKSRVEEAFERFVSLDGRGGSGLGLPIAQGLARSHGGDLDYDGGAFVVRLATLGGAQPPA